MTSPFWGVNIAWSPQEKSPSLLASSVKSRPGVPQTLSHPTQKTKGLVFHTVETLHVFFSQQMVQAERLVPSGPGKKPVRPGRADWRLAGSGSNPEHGRAASHPVFMEKHFLFSSPEEGSTASNSQRGLCFERLRVTDYIRL